MTDQTQTIGDNMAEPDDDTIIFDLWEDLVACGYENAALGLLRDGCELMRQVEANLPDVRGKAKAMGQRNLVRLKEEMMVILNDKDGTMLPDWVRLCQSSDPVDQEDFYTLAFRCVEEAISKAAE